MVCSLKMPKLIIKGVLYMMKKRINGKLTSMNGEKALVEFPDGHVEKLTAKEFADRKLDPKNHRITCPYCGLILCFSIRYGGVYRKKPGNVHGPKCEYISITSENNKKVQGIKNVHAKLTYSYNEFVGGGRNRVSSSESKSSNKYGKSKGVRSESTPVRFAADISNADIVSGVNNMIYNVVGKLLNVYLDKNGQKVYFNIESKRGQQVALCLYLSSAKEINMKLESFTQINEYIALRGSKGRDVTIACLGEIQGNKSVNKANNGTDKYFIHTASIAYIEVDKRSLSEYIDANGCLRRRFKNKKIKNARVSSGTDSMRR